MSMPHPPLRPVPLDPDEPEPTPAAAEEAPGPPPAGAVRRDPETGAGSRYRRAERPVPVAGADGGPGTALELASAAEASAAGLAAPLGALAAAFRANAEALARSQEAQADLGRALQRADRSEMMVQTTGALNDTFKNLSSIQKGLLDRIEESGAEARRGRWFLPALVLAALAAVGVAVWFTLERVDLVARDAAASGDAADRVERVARESREEGKREAQASLGSEVSLLRTELDRVREEKAALEARLQESETARATEREARVSAESDLASQRSEVQTARTDLLARRAVEEEVGRLRAEAALRGPEVERLRQDLDAEKKETAALRLRLAEAGLGRDPASDVPAATPNPATSVPAPPAAPPSTTSLGADPTVVRDPRTLDRVRARMNDLLQSGNVGRTDFYQMQSIGGVAPTRLVDVVAMRYGPNGRLLNVIRAQELRVVVDRGRRVVEFAFSDGHLEYNQARVPFPEGAYTPVVAEGDLSAWSGSGLTFVTLR
jgi:hypothetical protein